jgi:hypothetical protein
MNFSPDAADAGSAGRPDSELGSTNIPPVNLAALSKSELLAFAIKQQAASKSLEEGMLKLTAQVEELRAKKVEADASEVLIARKMAVGLTREQAIHVIERQKHFDEAWAKGADSRKAEREQRLAAQGLK